MSTIVTVRTVPHPIPYMVQGLVFLAFLSGNPVFIAITVIIYAAAYAVFKLKNKEIVEYLDRMADKNLSVEEA